MASESSVKVGSGDGSVYFRFERDGFAGISDPVPYNAHASVMVEARRQAEERWAAASGQVKAKHQALVARAEELVGRVNSTKSACHQRGISPRSQTANLEAFSRLADLVRDLARAVAERT